MQDGKTRPPRRHARRGGIASVLVFGVAALGVLQFGNPPSYLARPFERTPTIVAALPLVQVSPVAFGKSGDVHVRLALPHDSIEYPLEVQGDPTALTYQWVRVLDSVAVDSLRPLGGAKVAAPDRPGFYRLAIARGTERVILDELTLSVLIPFERKTGPTLNGYRIGTYLAEKVRDGRDHPEGFVEVLDGDLAGLRISKHLRLGDLLSRDGQSQWPRYLAMSPRLLDKIELVLDKVVAMRGDTSAIDLRVNISAGYRTPSYNSTVDRAATNSRHQHGDAVDIAVDADGDGRFTSKDVRAVALAVEQVEREHPDLAGGLGQYTSRRYNTPYNHIDARGRRARWQG